MESARQRVTVLLADDDDDFCVLARKAIERAAVPAELQVVDNGEELLKYLRREDQYGGMERPVLVILDLNMPLKDGRAALREIRADQAFSSVPVIVLSTSRSERDVVASYRSGANSFISKPDSFGTLVDIMRAIKLYWFETVALP